MSAVRVVSAASLIERRELIASMLGEIGVPVDRVTWRFDPLEVMVLMECWQSELDQIRFLLGGEQ